MAIRHGLKDEQIEKLAASILSQLTRQEGYLSLNDDDENPRLRGAAHWIHVLRTPAPTSLAVTSPTFSWIPRNGVWIAEAVAQKSKKYGSNSCAGVTLLVDGGSYVAAEQVAAFAEDFDPSQCPFEHLWVATWDSVNQIK